MRKLIFLLMLFCGTISAQIKVTHFNAGWNKANDVEGVVVPTIIIFKDGEEVARFQADLSFKMVATEEEVQEEINDQMMSDF
jgi:hypothetical protein